MKIQNILLFNLIKSKYLFNNYSIIKSTSEFSFREHERLNDEEYFPFILEQQANRRKQNYKIYSKNL